MNKIGLVIDEGADLPKEIIEKYQIEVVPFKMDWPDIEGLLGENTFQKMREAEKRGIKSFGKTSQPSPKDFLEAFSRQFEKFKELICITITSKHSGTYNSACQAKNFLDYNPPTASSHSLREWAPSEKRKKVFVLDSLNGSGGMGLLVLRAIDLIERGEKKAEEIFKDLEAFRPKILLRGILKDPKWLEASGRISSIVANLIRRAEKIGLRPMLGVKNGVIKAVGIKTRAKDIPTALFNEFKEKTKKLLSQNKKIRAVITHGDNLEMAQRLKEMIERDLKNTEVAFINLIGNVIGVLAGPDALVLAWSEIT